jgi:hypothetical protein
MAQKRTLVVTWILSRVETGTRLRLVHSGFVTPRNDSALKTMGEAWKKVVPSIGAIACGPVGEKK